MKSTFIFCKSYPNLGNLFDANAALISSHISAYSGKSVSTASPLSSTKFPIPIISLIGVIHSLSASKEQSLSHYAARRRFDYNTVSSWKCGGLISLRQSSMLLSAKS